MTHLLVSKAHMKEMYQESQREPWAAQSDADLQFVEIVESIEMVSHVDLCE